VPVEKVAQESLTFVKSGIRLKGAVVSEMTTTKLNNI
jgi:hypothetical protein